MARRKMTPAPKDSATRADSVRADALVNAMTGLGEIARDKRNSGVFRLSGRVSRSEVNALWVEDGLAASLVEKPPAEVWREGFTVEHQGDEAVTAKLMKRAAELRLAETLRTAQEYERAYGGGAVLIGANDAGGVSDPSAELVDDRVTEVRWLLAIDPEDCTPESVDTNITSPTYGRVLTYRVTPRFGVGVSSASQVIVHRSRLIILPGRDIPQTERANRQGWGGSQLERAYEAIRNWRTIVDSLATMATDANVWVHRIPRLIELLTANRVDVVKAELLSRDMLRGVTNAIFCDSEGGIENASRSFAGLDNPVMAAMRDLAAAVDVPIALLFGVGGSGLAQSHETDLRRWYDSVRAEQSRMTPHVERLLRLIMRAPGGPTSGRELPEGWEVAWHPLERMAEAERADVTLKGAQADSLYFTMGLPARVIFRNRFATPALNIATTLTPDELAELDEADPMGDEPGDDAGQSAPRDGAPGDDAEDADDADDAGADA